MRLAARLSILACAATLGGVLLAGCGSTGGGLVTGGDDLTNGRRIFNEGWQGRQSCASCHTLAAAGPQAVGTIGPNLDDAFSGSRQQGFEESTFAEVVRWQIAFPGEGGVMPPDLVEGEDADDVAVFVARCAGNADDPACAPEGGGEITATDGAQIFAQAGCGNCHTLAAAGSSGTIGPSLDETSPSLDLAVDRITNGRGRMPAFKDQLSEDQINAVAVFVAENSGP